MPNGHSAKQQTTNESRDGRVPFRYDPDELITGLILSAITAVFGGFLFLYSQLDTVASDLEILSNDIVRIQDNVDRLVKTEAETSGNLKQLDHIVQELKGKIELLEILVADNSGGSFAPTGPVAGQPGPPGAGGQANEPRRPRQVPGSTKSRDTQVDDPRLEQMLRNLFDSRYWYVWVIITLITITLIVRGNRRVRRSRVNVLADRANAYAMRGAWSTGSGSDGISGSRLEEPPDIAGSPGPVDAGAEYGDDLLVGTARFVQSSNERSRTNLIKN